MYPEELKYSAEHEWIRVEDGRGTVGITHYAQDQLGDVVYVELPEVGRKVKKDEPFGVIESVKTLSDLYAPVSGTIVEVNEALMDQPELVNQDPYGKGWLMVVEIETPAELDDLMDAGGYRKSIGAEG